MTELFETLTHAIQGSPLTAIVAALIWGILSIVLSPCHLAGIPLIVGFIGEQGKMPMRRAFVISSLFALGILITIAVIGAITASLGRIMGDVGGWSNYLVAAVFFIVGLHLLGVIPIPFSGVGQVGFKMRGFTAAFILGLVFGIAIGPCTFAYMAPVMAISFKVAANNLPYAVALLVIYGIGHCSVIVLAGTSMELVQNYLDWNAASRGTLVLRRICGVLVIIGGLYLIYVSP